MGALADVRSVFRQLVANPGDKGTMLVLSDALEEAGALALAFAYRWAAENGKWPLQRTEGKGQVGYVGVERKVYDWDRALREGHCPPHARLPVLTYNAIRKLPGRRYGGIHRAFVLLAKALQTVGAAEGVSA